MQLSINKVVLLTTGTGEHSWYLIKKFRQQYQHILIIITQQPPNLMQRLKFLPYTVKQTMKFFVRYLLLRQRNYLPVQPPLFSDVFYSDDINSEIVYDQIKTFNPDLICIAGTKLVKDHILSLAKLCLNLHHGFLPYYRGVSCADWVSLQKNFDYYYVSVHEAVVALDSGSIFASKQVKPYLAESYKDFKRRMKLFGAEIMLHVCQNLQTIKPVPQPDNIPHHNYRHKEKVKAFSIYAKREYNSNNLRRYVINEGDGGEGRIFHIVNRCLQKQEEKYALQPGLYIVNYHDIINHEDLKSDYRIPNIFTSREKFLLHLKFYANEFELVSLSDGLKLLQQGKRLTKRYLVISFDDGFDSAKEVLPDINALGIEPTFFVNSDPLIDSKPLHNHQELICVHYSASYKTLNLKTLRDKYRYMLQNDCLNSSSNNITTNQDEFMDYVIKTYLNKDAIKQMLHENRIEIGTHTSCHSQLSGLDYETQYEIIKESHKKIEALLNLHIPYFSFPFGKLNHRDYCSEYIASKTAKYIFSCNGGINQTSEINGVILRIGIHNEAVSALRSLLARQRTR